MQYQAHIPMQLTQKFLDKLGYEPENQKILVIRDFLTAMCLAAKNSVVFITDDPEARDMFKNTVMFNPEFGSDDEVIYIDVENNKNAWKEFIEELPNMPKFDVAIMNPPYERNLHLKVLEQVIPLCDKVINISPVRWLQDPFAKYLKTSDYKKFEDSISKKIETLDIIDAKTASTIFDADFVMNLGIYVCGNGGYQYDNETPLIKKIIKKTFESSWTPFSLQNFYKNGAIQIKPYALKFGQFGGSGVSGKLDIITCQTYKKQVESTGITEDQIKHVVSGKIKGPCHFEFDTEDERRNFYDCYNHKFMRWTYRLWKSNVRIDDKKIPYFGDYTKPWTTKMFCDYFGITGYIDDEHAEPGSEWEEIMNQW